MITIFHNPRCGKSRDCLTFLNQSQEDVKIVNYLLHPPTFDELNKIIKMLDIEPIELVRKKESIWIADFWGKPLTDEEIVHAMVLNPILIERPIVIHGNKAVIARPYEKVKAIL
ncbi:MAG: arsenate reductase (glutaredoxin) [Flavobacterium sp.]|nr:arsenate reductase (glutaredoxin) [Flavobacterium sp.]